MIGLEKQQRLRLIGDKRKYPYIITCYKCKRNVRSLSEYANVCSECS